MNTAVIVAAGRSERFGVEDKQFVSLAGRPVLWYSLAAFASARRVGRIVLVTRPERIGYCRTELLKGSDFAARVTVVSGGRERQDSVWAGLEACPPETELVWVHDGARPLVTAGDIDASAAALDGLDGLVFASPVTDTLKQVEDGVITKTRAREQFWRAETPQLFWLDTLRSAHKRAVSDSFIGTDEAVLVERSGGRVGIFQPAGPNFKITTRDDLVWAEQIIRGQSSNSPHRIG